MDAPKIAIVLLCIALTLTMCTSPAYPATEKPRGKSTRSPVTDTPPPVLSTQPPSPTSSPAPLPSPTPDLVAPLMARMTVEEKVGQLFVVYSTQPVLNAELESAIVEDHVGGVILFAPNIEHPAQAATLINQAQAAATSSGAGIPLLVAIDQEGGRVTRLRDGFAQFPGNMAVGATHNPDSARLMAHTLAYEMQALGINMNLAPVLDINSNPRNPVIGTRSFGGSPELVVQMGLPMMAVYREQGIISLVKHFPGHGDTNVDSHHDLPSVSHSLDRLWSVELAPFQAAIDAGVDVIMTAHVSFPAVDPTPGLPATLSPLVLQDLLRTRMGFDGVIATDSLGMDALSDMYGEPEAAASALQAGADLLMFGMDPGHTPSEARAAYAHVLELVRSGAISMERVEVSVRRILALKVRYGLLKWQPVNPMVAAQSCGTADHHAAALRVALDSITLLENDGILPLPAEQSVLLVVPARVTGLDDALRAYLPSLTVVQVDLDPIHSQIAAAVTQAANADTVIVATWNANQHPSQVLLVQALGEYPLVIVALDTPYDLTALQAADVMPSAYVCTYSDVPPALDALAMVLGGIELPRGQLPVAVGDTYPMGYGWQRFEGP